MWTVTLKLKPLVVLGHLLGGFAILALLWWLLLGDVNWSRPNWNGRRRRGLFAAALVGCLIVIGQITLGGWTSTNYAALACPDFPTCQNQWWPHANFAEGFTLWRHQGLNYDHGVLDSPGRIAIHLTHRMGALITSIYLTILGLSLIFRRRLVTAVRVMGMVLLAVLYTQVSLGISNVVLGLPLPVAVAHNAGAVLLLLTLLTLLFMLKSRGNPIVPNFTS